MSLPSALVRRVVLRLTGRPRFRRLATTSRPGRAVASRFVAGETLADSLRAARDLRESGMTSMLDHLGENVDSPEQALAARAAYLSALDALAARPDLGGSIAIKLTQLGLDSSIEGCWANVVPLLEVADARHVFVMIDMESHRYVDDTLEIARRAAERGSAAGVALQAYLRRTERDLFNLPEGMRVRLVKGAYLESADVVYPRKRDVDASFARCFATLLARGHPIDVATHDPALIEGVRTRVDSTPKGWSRVEFQMLYGVRRDLQTRLAGQGYPVRVYVPYGTEWYPYLTRRLAERPANLWFFASNLLRISR